MTSPPPCRRHPLPSERKMKELLQLTQELGITLDASSSGGLHRSLQAAKRAMTDGACAEALTLMLTKPMQLAQYFCTGDVSGDQLLGLCCTACVLLCCCVAGRAAAGMTKHSEAALHVVMEQVGCKCNNATAALHQTASIML